jgi:hypothetical protein
MGEEYFDLEVREGIFLYRRETLVNSKRTKKGVGSRRNPGLLPALMCASFFGQWKTLSETMNGEKRWLAGSRF